MAVVILNRGPKHPAECDNCGAEVAVGAPISLRRGRSLRDSKIVSCPSCNGGSLAEAGEPVAAATAAATTRRTADKPPTDAPATAMTVKSAADPVKSVADPVRVPAPAEPEADTDPVYAADPFPPPPMLQLPYVEGMGEALQLDGYQQQVVDVRAGEVVVAAAPGSGKTTCLVERAVRLVEEGVHPKKILILVYNKAAAETLQIRLLKRGVAYADRVALTFHSFGYYVLRTMYRNEPHLTSNRVVDKSGPRSTSMAYGIIKAHKLKGGADTFINAYGIAREALIRFDAPDAVERVMEILARSGQHPDEEVAAHLVTFGLAYEKAKREQNCLDYSDMIAEFALRLQSDPALQDIFAGVFEHVMVDEAQDVNPARLNIALHLGRHARSLMFVGDVAQSINSHAGARPELFVNRIQSGAKLLHMPVNRRSTRTVIALSNEIVRGRSWRIGLDAIPRPNAEVGPAPVLWRSADEHEEASAIVACVKRWKAAGIPLIDARQRPRVACLVRTNAQAAVIESRLTSAGIAARTAGDERGVWATKEAIDLLAYARLLNTRGVVAGELAGTDAPDVQTALVRVLNKPLRGVSNDSVQHLAMSVAHAGESLVTGLRRMRRPEISRFAGELEAAARLPWQQQCRTINGWLASAISQDENALEAMNERDSNRLDNYRGLAEVMAGFSGFPELLEHTLRARGKAGLTEVTISTVHKMKGGEADAVIVCGLRAGIFPHAKALRRGDPDEELRLFYVACSRARDVLILSSGGTPSTYFRNVFKLLDYWTRTLQGGRP